VPMRADVVDAVISHTRYVLYGLNYH